MNRLTVFVLITTAVGMQTNTRAEVFERDWKTPGDGLLTLDNLNHREWLDLTETQLFQFPGITFEDKFQTVADETLEGGLFAGFVIADRDKVFALSESAGIVTSTSDPAQNQIAAQKLVALLGVTSGNASVGSSHGTFGSIDGRSGDFTGYAIFNRPGAAGIEFRLGGTQVGVWLYRPIPEPTTAIFLANAFWIFTLRGTKGELKGTGVDSTKFDFRPLQFPFSFPQRRSFDRRFSLSVRFAWFNVP